MPERKLTLEIEVEETVRRNGRKRRGRRRGHPGRGLCERNGARARPLLLAFARKLACRAGGRHPLGLSTVDDVHDALVRHGHGSSALGSAAGAVFRGKEWVRTRLRVRSRRLLARGREIKVWRLAGKPGAEPSAPNGKSAPPDFAFLIDDYRSLAGLPAAAATEPRRICPLCRDFPGCVGFCEHFDPFGESSEGRGRRKP